MATTCKFISKKLQKIAANSQMKSTTKKRSARDAGLDTSNSDELTQLCEAIRSTESITFDQFQGLNSLLKKLAKEEDGKKSVEKTIDNQFIAILLGSYTASLSENDTKIYSILERLERKFDYNLTSMQPIVWGEKAKEHYKKLFSLGPTLHRISPNQILDLLEPTKILCTAKNHTRDNFPHIYDAKFLMQLFSSILQPSSEISFIKFIKNNCLALTFTCISSKDATTRTLAYYNLQRFLSLLLELKEETFSEKSIYVYILRLFKQSVTKETPRISHLITHFFSRISTMLLYPNDPLYGVIMAFLCQMPQIDLQNIPNFYHLFLSTSVENYTKEREWILQLVSEAIIDPIDYNVLQNRANMKILLAMFNTCLVDQPVKKHILAILKASVKIPSAAYDLFYRCNLAAWISMTIRNARFTKWERNYLAQIFVILLTKQKEYRETKGISEDKVATSIAKIAARSVTNVLKELVTETEEVSAAHLDALEQYFAE